MKLSEKSKQLLLVILLLVIIGGGTALILTKQDQEVQHPNDIAMSPDVEAYYVEEFLNEEQDTYEDIQSQFASFKGDVVKIISSGDGAKLVNMKNMEPIMDIPQEAFSGAKGYTIDEKSNFVTIGYDQQQKMVVVKTFDQKGNMVTKPIALKDFGGILRDDGFFAVRQFRIDRQHIYVLTVAKEYSILQIFNRDGSLHANHPVINSFDIDDKGNLYIAFPASVSGERKKIGVEKIKIDTGEMVYDIETYDAPTHIRYNPKGDTLYVMDEAGIVTYTATDGKKIKEVFIFGEDTTYLGNTYVHADFFIGREQDLYLSLVEYKDGEGPINYCYRYELTEGRRQEVAVTFTVTAPYRQDFLADAILRYQLKYPDKKIQYDYQYNSRREFLEHREQYGQQLTLSILSGDIGDIVMTGGSHLIYKDLFKTDAFMDLTPLIEKDEKYSHLNQNALEGIRINDSIRGLPISITSSFYEVNTALADSIGLELDYNNLSWRDVISLRKVIEEKAPDAYVFNGTVDDPFINILISNMPQLIDLENKEVNLNQDWFTTLLKEYKIAAKSGNLLETGQEFDMFDMLHNALFVVRNNNEFSYYDMVYRYMGYNKDEKQSLYIPFFTGEISDNRIAYSNNMYSINNKSENKEEAWKFLSFLLEEDIQMLATLPGKPLNTKADRTLLENAANRYKENYEQEDPVIFVDMMSNISNKIDYLYDMDYFKLDMYEPISRYMKDEITLEKALKEAEQNIWIRLHE